MILSGRDTGGRSIAQAQISVSGLRVSVCILREEIRMFHVYKSVQRESRAFRLQTPKTASLRVIYVASFSWTTSETEYRRCTVFANNLAGYYRIANSLWTSNNNVI